jgi:glycosyltransferase involved in cell wall biosynthesis
MPPLKKDANLKERLKGLGIKGHLDIRPTQFLHSRWKKWPYVKFLRPLLKNGDEIYVRSSELSLALLKESLAHSLEIHNTSELMEKGLMNAIIHGHRSGLIKWLIPISHAAKDVLMQNGAISERIHVSPSGVDLSLFQGVSRFSPEGLERPRMNYLGRISLGRGLHIFQELSKRPEYQIILVGEQDDSPWDTSQLKIVPFVTHQEVARWYDVTDIVLLPYQRSLPQAGSISPIKLFEAMAAGRPIIASNLPPIREIIEHEKTGLLVEPSDITAWIEAIERLRREPDLAVRLASAARKKAEQYSWIRRAEGIARALGWNKNHV